MEALETQEHHMAQVVIAHSCWPTFLMHAACFVHTATDNVMLMVDTYIFTPRPSTHFAEPCRRRK